MGRVPAESQECWVLYSPTAYEHDFSSWSKGWASSSLPGFCEWWRKQWGSEKVTGEGWKEERTYRETEQSVQSVPLVSLHCKYKTWMLLGKSYISSPALTVQILNPHCTFSASFLHPINNVCLRHAQTPSNTHTLRHKRWLTLYATAKSINSESLVLGTDRERSQTCKACLAGNGQPQCFK